MPFSPPHTSAQCLATRTCTYQSQIWRNLVPHTHTQTIALTQFSTTHTSVTGLTSSNTTPTHTRQFQVWRHLSAHTQVSLRLSVILHHTRVERHCHPSSVYIALNEQDADELLLRTTPTQIYHTHQKGLATLDGEILDPKIRVELEIRDVIKVHDAKPNIHTIWYIEWNSIFHKMGMRK